MYSKWDRIISALATWIKNISRVSKAKRGRYELIQVTCAEIILSHFESIWWYFSHTFHYLTDEISWKYEKTFKVEPGCWPLSFARVLRPHHVDYAHHVSYVCTSYASNIGDVPEYVYPSHTCESMRWLSHSWSGWDVFWEVHCITWLFSKKVWEYGIVSKLMDTLRLPVNKIHCVARWNPFIDHFAGTVVYTLLLAFR